MPAAMFKDSYFVCMRLFTLEQFILVSCPPVCLARFNEVGFRNGRDLVYPAVDQPTAQPSHLGFIPDVILLVNL